MSKKRKFLVINKIEKGYGEYDCLILPEEIRYLEEEPTNKITTMISHKVPVVEIGEIIILNDDGDSYGRDYLGNFKPSKWFIEWKEFDDLEEAITYSRSIYGTEETE
jgi:hypothetical protein